MEMSVYSWFYVVNLFISANGVDVTSNYRLKIAIGVFHFLNLLCFQVPKEMELVWDDSVAPEAAIDLEGAHVSTKEVLMMLGGAFASFFVLYKLIEFGDPVGSNPSVRERFWTQTSSYAKTNNVDFLEYILAFCLLWHIFLVVWLQAPRATILPDIEALKAEMGMEPAAESD